MSFEFTFEEIKYILVKDDEKLILRVQNSNDEVYWVIKYYNVKCAFEYLSNNKIKSIKENSSTILIELNNYVIYTFKKKFDNQFKFFNLENSIAIQNNNINDLKDILIKIQKQVDELSKSNQKNNKIKINSKVLESVYLNQIENDRMIIKNIKNPTKKMYIKFTKTITNCSEVFELDINFDQDFYYELLNANIRIIKYIQHVVTVDTVFKYLLSKYTNTQWIINNSKFRFNDDQMKQLIKLDITNFQFASEDVRKDLDYIKELSTVLPRNDFFLFKHTINPTIEFTDYILNENESIIEFVQNPTIDQWKNVIPKLSNYKIKLIVSKIDVLEEVALLIMDKHLDSFRHFKTKTLQMCIKAITQNQNNISYVPQEYIDNVIEITD
jgi:hypothetical protein